MTREEILSDIKKMANVLRSVEGKPDADVVVGMPLTVAIEAGFITDAEAAIRLSNGHWTYAFTDKASA